MVIYDLDDKVLHWLLVFGGVFLSSFGHAIAEFFGVSLTAWLWKWKKSSRQK
jgi:hypothetical protein